MSEQTQAELGERRRRREEERRRLSGEQPVASTGAGGGAPVIAEPASQLLSRREMRERAAAAAADVAGAVATPAAEASQIRRPVAPTAAPTPAPAARPAPAPAARPAPAPAPTPARPAMPAPAPERQLSRRELRDRAAATQEAAAPAAAGRPDVPAPTPAAQPQAPSPLSPQARTAAIRAQAARAQAEREEAARANVERAQIQRAASQRAQAGQPRPRQAGVGEVESPPASMWTQRPTQGAGPAGGPGAGPIDSYPAAQARVQPAVPAAPAPAMPRPQPAAPDPQSAVRRVVLPPADVPAERTADGAPVPTLHPDDGTPPGGQRRSAQPAASPVQAYRPTQAAPAPVQPAYTPVQPAASNGTANGPARQTAFVPAEQAPAVGQPFGTVVKTGMGVTGLRPVPGAITPPESGESALPRWGNVGGGQWSPTPTFDAASVAPEQADTDEELDEAPHHPYTWLQMIILVLVAFILGMLIFMVVMQDPKPSAAGTAGAQLVALERVDVPEGTGD